MQLIWVKGHRKPKYIHRGLTGAIKEAERLAIKEGRRVYVFAFFNSVKLVDGKLIWELTDESPKGMEEKDKGVQVVSPDAQSHVPESERDGKAQKQDNDASVSDKASIRQQRKNEPQARKRSEQLF